MKMPSFLSKISQFFSDGLSLSEKKKLANAECRLAEINSAKPNNKDAKHISMEDLYKIIGNADGESRSNDPHKYKFQHPTLSPYRSFSFELQRKIEEFSPELKSHISVEDNPEDVYIPEQNEYYQTKYKVVVKNLVIHVGNFSDNENPHLNMYFDSIKEPRPFFFEPRSIEDDIMLKKPAPTEKHGIYLIFEDNCFISTDDIVSTALFLPKVKAYFIFKNNLFGAVNLNLNASNLTLDTPSKTEITSNIFINSDVKIYGGGIVCIKDNILHKNNTTSVLDVDGSCYFRGKNTVDNLRLYLGNRHVIYHWEGHQNIDPQGKYAYPHKKMFIDLMDESIKKNDKTQEAKLRRELLKCERVVIRENQDWNSRQDRFILWWSHWVSDYGISWTRPFCWLISINALWAVIIYFSPSQCPAWLSLFVELFNPLSDISKMQGIESNAWISFLKITQKALLATCYYETIKILRRFSK